MVNTTYPELSETKAQSLPAAELNILKALRQEMCSDSKKKDYKLQPQQRFLRRVLSPESNTRNLLMVHGTGTGKTCTAIQIAEEYIIRPEFQNKRVLMLSNPSVQDNFKNEIFSIDKLSQDADGVLESKQCTGRRYLEIVQRAQSQSLSVTDPVVKEKLRGMANRVIDEFYEFFGYDSFANYVDISNERHPNRSPNDFKKWIHDTFDDRLIIVDEAHNLRVISETSPTEKISAQAIEAIIKEAKGVTLVLLTATPMFDNYNEIIYYFNLFLWNDKLLDTSKENTANDIFETDGRFKEGQESRFRGWCQDYISYIKGENPFTFPFRLPPPKELIAPIDRKISHLGEPIKNPRKYLTLTKSIVSPFQQSIIESLPIRLGGSGPLICVYPENKNFGETFGRNAEQYEYRKDTEKFLSPSKVATYSSKFSLIIDSLKNSSGIVFVYSNLVENGANLFAMCLEEHGYDNAISENFLGNPSGETQKGSSGKYVIFTGQTGDVQIKKALTRLKDRRNMDGKDIRVIIASEKVSEGVDFRYVRQIHVLDPWFNMSRIEQVLGRGMRTCSHALLPFDQQNCTVYLHVCRYESGNKESADEYIYRQFVEEKGARIAKLKKVIMESSMDCDLQQGINNLPTDWRNLTIPQIRSQDKQELNLSLMEMSAPTFEDKITDMVCRLKEDDPDEEHTRPLSAILDIRDEVFDKLIKLFSKKSVWSIKDLFNQSTMKQYSKDVLEYLVQNAIESNFEIKDRLGRYGKLQSKDGIITLTLKDNDTLAEKMISDNKGREVPIPKKTVIEDALEEAEDVSIISKRKSYAWPVGIDKGFDDEVLDWFIVDSVLTPAERITHLLNLDWSNPPFYAERLIAKMKNGNSLYILGSGKIYNNDKKLITPVGEEQDVYRKWINEQKDWFLEKREDIYATSVKSTVSFFIENDLTIKRAVRSKRFEAKQCSSFLGPVVVEFVKWLSGDDIPENVNKKEYRCLYLELLIRRTILSNKPGIFWVPPQIYEIFLEDETRRDLVSRLK